MQDNYQPNPAFVAGYALGIGLCTVATIGIIVNFWLAGANNRLLFSLTFVGGAVIGTLPALIDFKKTS